MKNTEISEKVNQLKEYTKLINQLMEDLHKQNVEIRFAYKDAKEKDSAQLDLWKIVEHVDYLKEQE